MKKEAESRISRGEFPKREIEVSGEIPDAYSRTLALASIFRELCDSGMKDEEIWNLSLESAEKIEPEWKREEMLEKLTSWGIRCGKDVAFLPDMLEDRELIMKLVSKIVRISNKEKMMEIWKSWSERPEKDRYELLRIMVHNGFPKDMALEMSEELSEDKKEMIKRYVGGLSMGEKKGEMNVEEALPEIAPLDENEPEFALALYNTYKGKASDIHFRSISRAAALCYAFDLKLLLVNFPFSSEEECVKRTMESTRIGDGAEYLNELLRAHRFLIKPDINAVNGDIVATTPNPNTEKSIKVEETEKGMVFLMGLGHAGLPERILKSAEHHLELTGKNASLETCTAMGVLACALAIRRKSYIMD